MKVIESNKVVPLFRLLLMGQPQGLQDAICRDLQGFVDNVSFEVEKPRMRTCHTCRFGVPLDNNCVLSTNGHLHCTMGRGLEERNVWHKYKKYYKDYSLVEHSDYCSSWEDAESDGGENG